MRRNVVPLLALALSLAHAAKAQTTITVGQGGGYDHATIQSAIDVATTGDTVLVHPGTYVENIHFHGKNIVLRSTDPTDTATVAATIIDGNSSGSVVTFAGGETSSCVLSGFTIRNGKSGFGGGICGYGTRATIQNNTITDNSFAGWYPTGGGLYDCDGLIQNNTISGNSVDYAGGGLAFCDGTIQNNTITGNSATNGWAYAMTYGGGLAWCHGTIQNNTVTGNTSGNKGGGLFGCDGTIQNNTIAGNSSHTGAGLSMCHGTIQNNTISRNSTTPSAFSSAGSGGGLSACNGTIQNNTISSNKANYGEGGGLSACSGAIQNNTITTNTASWGGGLSACNGTTQNNTIRGNTAGTGGALYQCFGTIQNNVISGNSANDGGGLAWCGGTMQNNVISNNTAKYGGGLFRCGDIYYERYRVIRNNTISSNTATGSGGGLYWCEAPITNCIIWQNSAPTSAQLDRCTTPSHSCIEAWTGGGLGNIRDNPRLADPANGDFHLLPNSPCIDAGGTVSLTQDFEGDPRPFDFTDLPRGDGSDFDIGADEVVPAFELRTAADPTEGGAVVPSGRTRCLSGTTVTVTAIPNCGWAFDHWSGDAAGTTNPIAIVMDTTRTVTAHFVAIPGFDLEGRLDGVSPGTIVVGGLVSLQGEVANAGDEASTSTFWVEFWLHNKETGWRGVLCDSIRIGPLGAGESFDLADIAPPRMAYTNIPPGMYAIEMRIDVLGEVAESCEANNVARWEPCVILPDRPNLAVTGFDFSPQDVAPEGGTTMTFSGLVENTGSRPTTGSFWIEFRVSRELPFNPAGPYVCDSLGVTQAIGPGETLDFGPLLRTTYALPPGVYYVGIRLDPLDAIAEQSEDDNITWLPRKKLYAGPRPTDVQSWAQYR